MNSQEVMFEFPRHLLALLRCSQDGGELICTEAQSGSIGVIEGTLRCRTCSEEYRITKVSRALQQASQTRGNTGIDMSAFEGHRI